MGRMTANKHIIDILEGGPLTGISEEQMATVRLHTESCAPCRKALEAARLSNFLIHKRTTEVVEPSPFFQTRVMAALRERQTKESVPAIVRLWKSAGGLVSSMALSTAALAVFSVLIPGSSTSTIGQETAVLNSFSAEGVILGQEQNDDQISYDQVLNTIYDDEAK